MKSAGRRVRGSVPLVINRGVRFFHLLPKFSVRAPLALPCAVAEVSHGCKIWKACGGMQVEEQRNRHYCYHLSGVLDLLLHFQQLLCAFLTPSQK